MIGHHLLEGKIVTLAKPLAVIHRVGPTKDGPESDNMDEDQDAETMTKPTTRWDMLAIVKKKIVFAKRPMPIVGSAGPKLKT
jgi:chromosome transmission fidelity protein 8